MSASTRRGRASAAWLRADGLLLLTALIWGLAFSAQRKGMEFIGPMAYNALRYLIGVLCMLPLVSRSLRARRKSDGARGAAAAASSATATAPSAPGNPGHLSARDKILGSVLAGTCMFLGAGLQQIGLVSTTAGNAGFITSLYVVIVPILGIIVGRKVSGRVWFSVALAVAGLYLLSVREGFTVSPGDGYVLACAFFWALHILIVARLAPRMDVAELGLGQYLVCAALSLASALIFEPQPFAGAGDALIPILYGGFLSIGVAFTLQIVAQKDAHPTHASIILSMESLFAAVGGALLLGERMDARTLAGGALMLAGMIISQVGPNEPKPERSESLAEPVS